MIDLHAHSTYSDGSLTPVQLAAHAAELGLAAVALTDHDTTAGLDAFLDAARAGSIRGVPGVEISVDCPEGTLHMLGYFFDAGNEALQSVLRRIRDGRCERNELIAKRLGELNMPLTMEEVRSFAGEDLVSRTHFAQAMLARGYVRSFKDAFNRYLGRGKPAYVNRFRLAAGPAISVIRDAGGVSVLAHPSTLGLKSHALAQCVGELVAHGLSGIEVYYSEHNPAQVKEYLALAQTLNLVATGGSDFHGAANPLIELGSGFGSLRVPDDVVDRLYERVPR